MKPKAGRVLDAAEFARKIAEQAEQDEWTRLLYSVDTRKTTRLSWKEAS